MRHCEDVLLELLKISERVAPEIQRNIEIHANIFYMNFRKREEGKPKEITMHTVKKILPCIAFYKAFSELTGDKKKAYDIIETYFYERSKERANKLQSICKVPGVYRLVPMVMGGVIHQVFGVKSGFEQVDREMTAQKCHIDMLGCPYYALCELYGCKELVRVFCDSDDVAYGNMHPRLSWERTKTLGRGDYYCDFKLKIKER